MTPELSAPRLRCREVVELLTDYLEDALPAAERARVAEHLATCPDCTAYVEQLRDEIMGSVREGRPDALTPFTGQTAGLIAEVLPAAEIVRRLAAGACDALTRAAGACA